MNSIFKHQPSFIGNIGIAIILSLTGAAALSVLNSIFPGSFSLRLTIGFLSFAYIIYLLAKAPKPNGRIILTIACFLMTATSLVLGWSLTYFILSQSFLIWLVRSYTRYKHFLPTVIDGGVIATGLVFALWAALTTSSFLTALWCFYLVQSLFTLIPNQALPFVRHNKPIVSKNESELFKHSQAFSRSAQSAHAALSQLSQSPLN